MNCKKKMKTELSADGRLASTDRRPSQGAAAATGAAPRRSRRRRRHRRPHQERRLANRRQFRRGNLIHFIE